MGLRGGPRGRGSPRRLLVLGVFGYYATRPICNRFETAVGSKRLAVGGNVVAATGDGGFLMNAAEIETATRVGCSVTILAFVDDDYGLISEHRVEHTDESFGTELTNSDLVAFAESYRPDSPGELRTALREAVGGGMSLVEMPVA